MLLQLDQSDDRPLYQQLAASVRRGIVTGDLKPGDRLPPTRDAAGALGVNAETVQRAYRLLADEGLVASRVGRGTRIREDVDAADLRLDRAIDELVAAALSIGWSRQDLAQRILQG